MDKWIDRFIEIEEASITLIESVISTCVSNLDENPEEEFITDEVIDTLVNDPSCREFTDFITERERPISKRDARRKIKGRVYVDLIQRFEIRDNGTTIVVYLEFEAKRLNVNFQSGFKSLVDQYVEEGVCDFVSEKYETQFPLACMLGYVMNGDFNGLQEKIGKKLLSWNHKTNLESGPSRLDAIGHTERFETVHKRSNSGNKVAIRHTLLNCSKEKTVSL